MVFTLLLYLFLLLLSFFLLAKVCDKYFVVSLDKIAHKWKLSSDAAGATLMAIGSSAPELFVAIIAIIRPGEHASIGMGTIVGSALFNILVIIGAVAIIKTTIIMWQPVVRDVLFYALSIIILILAFKDGSIDLMEAALFVIMYVAYVVAVVNWRKIFPFDDTGWEEEEEDKSSVKKEKKSLLSRFLSPFDYLLDKMFPSPNHYYMVFIISILIIAGLSWILVESAIIISAALNVPESIVALTVLAAGTSVPDMISSIIVAKQGRGGMAISNAVGSNVFDILIGLGLPWLVLLLFNGGTITVSTENLYSSVILLFATVLVIFFLLFLSKWKFSRKAGVFLIALYVIYVIYAVS